MVNVQLPAQRYPDAEQRVAFQGRLLDQLAALPGVGAVGLSQSLPLVRDYEYVAKLARAFLDREGRGRLRVVQDARACCALSRKLT